MKTIRRIYIYAVALISMELILWGIIDLARTLFSTSFSSASQLSQALALTLVGVPVFGIHWWLAQRSAAQDEEERHSLLRALFLYAALLALLIPVIQNLLAFVNRVLLKLFDLPISNALIGGYQSLSDNIIAILLNTLIAAYFLHILRADWAEVEDQKGLTLMRRIYRYLWVLYALGISIFGSNFLLRYLVSLLAGFRSDDVYFNKMLANGLALLLVGIPLWVWAWKVVQDSLNTPAERASLLRLGLLYLLSLSGVLFVLSASGIVVQNLLLLLLGDLRTFASFIEEINEPLAVAIPLGVVWAYYGHWLNRDLDILPSAPRRAALRRLYRYILAFIGLGAIFIGLAMLLSFIIDIFSKIDLWGSAMESRLSGALATLIIGLPLWLKYWRQVQGSALASGEEGEHARRSLIRKTYLYLAVFAGVVGGMIVAVQFFSLLLNALLGSPPNNFTQRLLNALQLLILFSGLLAYHWQSLRRDGSKVSKVLSAKRAEFNVLLLADENDPLALQLASVMEKECPEINLIVQPAPETDSHVHAVTLLSDALLNGGEMLKTWLSAFNGNKFILTREAEDWHWFNLPEEIAQSLRALAEGEEIKKPGKTPGWMVLVYILAGMMAVEILFSLTMMVVSSF